MWMIGLVGSVALLVTVTTARRMVLIKATPWEMWPALAVSAASPVLMAWLVLFPREVEPVGDVSGVGDRVEFDAMQGRELMVTAVLPPASDEVGERTSYALKLQGKGWMQTITATVDRSDADAVDAEEFGGVGVRGADTMRSTRFGEDLQERFRLKGTGPTRLEASNWHGSAASGLDLALVTAPPSPVLTWGLVIAVSLLGLWCDVRRGTDRLATDVAFLAFWAAYLRDGVTPLDDWQAVLMAMAGALVSSWVVGRLIGDFAGKLLGPKEDES